MVTKTPNELAELPYLTVRQAAETDCKSPRSTSVASWQLARSLALSASSESGGSVRPSC